MFTLVIMVERPFDWTHAEFIDWWRGEHAQSTNALPGLVNWWHTEIESRQDPFTGPWNGMAVLSFVSAGDRRRALRSPEWSQHMAHHGMTTGRSLVLEGSARSMTR